MLTLFKHAYSTRLKSSKHAKMSANVTLYYIEVRDIIRDTMAILIMTLLLMNSLIMKITTTLNMGDNTYVQWNIT